MLASEVMTDSDVVEYLDELPARIALEAARTCEDSSGSEGK